MQLEVCRILGLQMLNYNIKLSKLLIAAGLVFYLTVFVPLVVFAQMDWSQPLKRCWVVNNDIGNKIASDNDAKYLITFTDNNIKLLNTESGKINWEMPIAGTLVDEPVVFGTSIYFFAETVNNKKSLSSINIESGLLNWRIYINFVGKKIIAKNTLYILDESEKKIYKVNHFDGKIIFESLYRNNTELILLLDNKLLVQDSDKIILRNQIANNENTRNLKSGINNILNLTKGNFIWANNNNEVGIYSLILKDNIWTRKIGGKITSLKSLENILFITSLDNFVYFFDIKNGELLYKKRLDGRIVKSSNIYQDKIIVSAYNSSSVFIFDMRKVNNINQVTLSDSEFAEGFVFIENSLIITTQDKIYAFRPSCN